MSFKHVTPWMIFAFVVCHWSNMNHHQRIVSSSEYEWSRLVDQRLCDVSWRPCHMCYFPFTPSTSIISKRPWQSSICLCWVLMVECLCSCFNRSMNGVAHPKMRNQLGGTPFLKVLHWLSCFLVLYLPILLIGPTTGGVLLVPHWWFF